MLQEGKAVLELLVLVYQHDAMLAGFTFSVELSSYMAAVPSSLPRFLPTSWEVVSVSGS